MGRRKLKFVIRKNHERKKRNVREPLVVNVPAPHFLKSPATNLHALHRRLQVENNLPTGWTCTLHSST